MTPKPTSVHLHWLEFLHNSGPSSGDNFGNRVKGTCARRGWAEWDRRTATWAITKAGLLTMRRAKALQSGGSGLLLSR